ncbi:MAG: 2-amino-4-hydroxy-6-hydroxymethyldihydropteridine diphosphokinase [Micropepsaceae bacterium]
MILIALGANEASRRGPPPETFRAALETLEGMGVKTLQLSRLFTSPAWPDPKDPPFTNAVARVETALPPVELMAALHAVEAGFGRERRVPNAPRPLDLDLIDYAGRVESPPGGPVLPHPRAAERAFVLAPLLDVAPEWVDPVSGRTGQELLKTAEALGNRAFPAQINIP